VAHSEAVVPAFLDAIDNGVDVETAATYVAEDLDAPVAHMPDLHVVDAW
jgi:hypothetical protein